jgi:hypothetical protein
VAIGIAIAGYIGASGMTGAIVAGAINGAIIGAAVGAVSAAVQGGDILKGMGNGALMGAAAGAIGGAISGAFAEAGGNAIPTGTDVSSVPVSEVGSATESGVAQAATTPTSTGVVAPSLDAPVVGAGGVTQSAGAVSPPPVSPPPQLVGDSAIKGMGTPGGVTAPPVSTLSDSAYLKIIADMGKKSFYQEAASGVIQGGLGAYATKEASKSEAEMRQQELDRIEAQKISGIVPMNVGAPTIGPSFAADKPRVTAPTANRPTAVQVGVTRPTADLRNITVQQGVLPNG